MYWLKSGIILLSVATLLCNAERILLLVTAPRIDQCNFHCAVAPFTNDPIVDSARSLCERHVSRNSNVYLLFCGNESYGPLNTAIHQAVAWSLSPQPVCFGDCRTIGNPDAILVWPRTPESQLTFLGFPSSKYLVAEEDANLSLYLRKEISGSSTLPGDVVTAKELSPVGELAGLLCPFAIIAFGTLMSGLAEALLGLALFSILMGIPVVCAFHSSALFVLIAELLSFIAIFMYGIFKPPNKHFRFQNIALLTVGISKAIPSFAAFTLSAFIALSHTLTAPNGLGVFAGKAKLLFLSNGIPPGFFSHNAYESLQPAYPPGVALIVLGCQSLSTGCGEWLTQLLPCFAYALLVYVVCSKATSVLCCFWQFVALASGILLPAASQFYAEPLMCLYLLVGWCEVRKDGDAHVAWLLMGLSGWFKNEGLVFLLAAWVAIRLILGAEKASLQSLLIALLVPVGWHTICRLHGASLPEISFPFLPNASKGISALVSSLQTAFLQPWEYGFVFPVAVAIFAKSHLFGDHIAPRHNRQWMDAAVLFSVISFFAISYLFSLSLSPVFCWHVESALPRLLWSPAVILLYELSSCLGLEAHRRR